MQVVMANRPRFQGALANGFMQNTDPQKPGDDATREHGYVPTVESVQQSGHCAGLRGGKTHV